MLQGVNLELHRGKVLALTGASGAGKSTLASLINRLYEPNGGCIKLDGVDIATLNPSWLRGKVRVGGTQVIMTGRHGSLNISAMCRMTLRALQLLG